MTINGKLENRGDIRTQQALTITGAVTNYNSLAGKDKVGISGDLTNNNKIVSQSNITVKGGSTIYNSGTMTSYGSMDLSSSTLTNTYLLQAVGTLTTRQTGEIYNSSSIYGGTVDLKTTGGSITNSARIIAKDSMSLDAYKDIVNQNQISLTGSGELNLKAGGNIWNDREYDKHYKFFNKEKLESNFPPARVAYDTMWEVNVRRDNWDWFDGTLGEYKVDSTDNGKEVEYPIKIIHKKYFIYEDKKYSEISSIQPQINSGGDIKLNGQSIDNSTGLISAKKNITIDGTTLVNNDIIQKRQVVVGAVEESSKRIEVERSSRWDSRSKSETVRDYKAQPLYIDPKLEIIYEHIPSLIKAGGKISGTLAGQVSLGSKESGGSKSGIYGPSGGGISSGSDNYSQVADEPQSPDASGAAYVQNRSAVGARAFKVSDPEASKFAPPPIETRQTLAQLSFERSKAVDATSGAPVPTPSSAALITMDEPTLTSLAEAIADSYAPPPMPTAPEITWEFDDPEITEAVGEDFTKHQSPGRYYIEETSPVFTDPGIYFSTDNFINRVDGFEPKKQAVHTQQPTHLHFGDSMKQMDFVRRQMVNLTGHAWLEDHIDYAQEIKNLYETGIRYGKDMKLKSGVALTEAQINALQDDMVWAETIELRGTKIVIPRLYVAKSKRAKKASGLLARNIDIDAGSFVNNGSSIIGENVSLKAHSGDIINKNGGDIYGLNHLGLYAARDIKNIGSQIASDGDMVLHAGRNIENITESKRYGDEKNHVTTVGKQSTIKAKGPLALFSGGDLLNKGSSIESGGLHFDVFGNMINDSIEDSYASEMVFNNGHRKERSVVYKPATISSSGSTKGFVAGNFALIGSRMSSTGDSEITVGGKSLLISQVNSKMLDTHSEYTTSGIISDKDHVESHQSLTETLAQSSLTAGGKNVLINDG